MKGRGKQLAVGAAATLTVVAAFLLVAQRAPPEHSMAIPPLAEKLRAAPARVTPVRTDSHDWAWWDDSVRDAASQPDAAARAALWRELAARTLSGGRALARRALERSRVIEPPALRLEFVDALFRQWAELEPGVAMDAAMESDDLAERRRGAATVMKVWAADGIEGPLRWLERQPPQGWLDRELHSFLADALARLDPQEALVRLEDSQADIVRRELYGPLLGRISQHDPALAAVVLLRAAAEPMQAALGGQIVSRWARQSPEAAAAFVASLPAGEARDRAAGWVAGAWAASAPEAAAGWAQSFPDGPPRERALHEIAFAWAARDAAAAGAWLQTLAAGSSRDAAVGAYCERIAGIDPQAALDWAKTIQTAPTKRRALEAIVTNGSRLPLAAASRNSGP